MADPSFSFLSQAPIHSALTGSNVHETVCHHILESFDRKLLIDACLEISKYNLMLSLPESNWTTLNELRALQQAKVEEVCGVSCRCAGPVWLRAE
jgi:hypothetical protein